MEEVTSKPILRHHYLFTFDSSIDDTSPPLILEMLLSNIILRSTVQIILQQQFRQRHLVSLSLYLSLSSISSFKLHRAWTATSHMKKVSK